MANAAAVHDLSGIGRCSLTTAIAVLASMGHCCTPIPTAVLSNQTGFEDYTFRDLSGDIPAYLAQWSKLDLPLDGIYTGFLGNKNLPRLLAEHLLPIYPRAWVLVDPVMADNGALYPCFDADYVEEMRFLSAQADAITPNATEFFLLSRESPSFDWTVLEDKDWPALLKRFAGPRLKTAVVTGCKNGGQAQNILIDLQEEKTFRIRYTDTGIHYSGTGDLLASLICGYVLRGMPMEQAVQKSTAFVSSVIAQCGPQDPRLGIPYEKFLGRVFHA